LFQSRKITFIGPGNMAGAIIYGLIKQNVAPAESLIAAGPYQYELDALNEAYGIVGYSNNLEAAQLADVVVLSVKPQTLDTVLAELKGKLAPTTLILSI